MLVTPGVVDWTQCRSIFRGLFELVLKCVGGAGGVGVPLCGMHSLEPNWHFPHLRRNSAAKSLIQRIASRFSRNGSISSTSGRCCRTSLFASSKVCAAPQTWYRGSRLIIATKPCSLMMVSPTTTTRHGSMPVGGVGLFFTVMQVLTNRSGSLQSFNCVFS